MNNSKITCEPTESVCKPKALITSWPPPIQERVVTKALRAQRTAKCRRQSSRARRRTTQRIDALYCREHYVVLRAGTHTTPTNAHWSSATDWTTTSTSIRIQHPSVHSITLSWEFLSLFLQLLALGIKSWNVSRDRKKLDEGRNKSCYLVHHWFNIIWMEQ